LLPLYTANRPEVHDIVAQMRSVVDAYWDRVLIGEIYLPIEQLVTYYGTNLNGANLPFNFQLLQVAWKAESIAALILEYEAALPNGAWPNWVLGNHDTKRLASRIGEPQARVGAMLLLTLRGTPTIYYGEEIGLEDVEIALDQIQDPAGKNQPGLGLGRDPERTPMPWDGSPLAGFTSGIPWLPLNPDHPAKNVEALRKSSHSILELYFKLVELRRANRVLSEGQLGGVRVSKNVVSYERFNTDTKIRVVLNLGHEPAKEAGVSGRVLLSTQLDRTGQMLSGDVSLRADEGIVVQIASAM
jgi:alpha-glucosidase